jgi:hypothetical protein
MSGSDPLKRLLETMPRERAREGFSARVLAALDRRADPPRRSRWSLRASGRRGSDPSLRARPWLVPAAAAAAGLVLVLAIAGTIHLARERERRAELAAQLRELRRDHQQLTEDLSDLRQKLQTKQVYLGGDHRADYVLDLRRLVDGPGPGTLDPMPQPVIHGPDDLFRGESL